MASETTSHHPNVNKFANGTVTWLITDKTPLQPPLQSVGICLPTTAVLVRVNNQLRLTADPVSQIGLVQFKKYGVFLVNGIRINDWGMSHSQKVHGLTIPPLGKDASFQ